MIIPGGRKGLAIIKCNLAPTSQIDLADSWQVLNALVQPRKYEHFLKGIGPERALHGD